MRPLYLIEKWCVINYLLSYVCNAMPPLPVLAAIIYVLVRVFLKFQPAVQALQTNPYRFYTFCAFLKFCAFLQMLL